MAQKAQVLLAIRIERWFERAGIELIFQRPPHVCYSLYPKINKDLVKHNFEFRLYSLKSPQESTTPLEFFKQKRHVYDEN
jgi:hypothetical protein